MATPSQNTERQGDDGRGWKFWAIIISLSIASLLGALDATAVTTAMPSIVEDLGSDYAYIWIANAYLLTMTAFQPLYGQTADIFGRRSLTIMAVVLFAVGSAICGGAPNMATLIAGRAVQGVGAAGLNVMVEVIVSDLLPLRERGQYMGYIFAIYAIGTSLGPVLGGVLAARVSWRWLFYLNLPVAGVAFVLLGASLRALPKKNHFSFAALRRVDFASNIILIAAIAAMLLALTRAGVEYPWSSWNTLVPLILGLAGVPLFFALQCVVPEPSMPLRIFSNRTSFAGFAMAFVHHILIYWTLFVFPVYFQGLMGENPTMSGVDLLPTAVISMPFAIVSGAFLSKFGKYRPWHFIGFAMFAVAYGLFTRLDADTTTAYWAGAQVIGAVGMGVLVTTTLPCIQAPLAESDVAVATATWGFLRGVGAIWGSAIPSAVFNARVDGLAAARLVGNATLRDAMSNGGAYAKASTNFVASLSPSEVQIVVRSIYTDSIKLCWQVGLGFAILGFLIAFLAKEVVMRTEHETEFGIEKGVRRSDEESGGSFPEPPNRDLSSSCTAK